MLLEYPTRDRLHQLRLTAMIAELDRQIQDPDITTLSFEDRLGLLVDAEWLARSNRQRNWLGTPLEHRNEQPLRGLVHDQRGWQGHPEKIL